MGNDPNPAEPWPSDRSLSEISLGCGFLSLVGVGVPVVTDSKVVMWAFIAVGCFGLAAVIGLRITRPLEARNGQSISSVMIGKWRWTLVAAVLAVIAITTASWLQRGAAPPPQPSIHPAAEPPKPAEPWVSEGEAEQAKKEGRVLLPFRPSEISGMNYRMGSEGTEAYVGKWVKINDLLLTVSVDRDRKDSLRVRILQPIWGAMLVFDAKKWGDQLRALNPNAGAKVRALCQLAKYDKESGNTDMTVPKFVGSNCELF